LKFFLNLVPTTICFLLFYSQPSYSPPCPGSTPGKLKLGLTNRRRKLHPCTGSVYPSLRSPLSRCHACRHASGNAQNHVNIGLSRCHAVTLATWNCQAGGEEIFRLPSPLFPPFPPVKSDPDLSEPFRTNPSQSEPQSEQFLQLLPGPTVFLRAICGLRVRLFRTSPKPGRYFPGI
jgi:hypothetical protein